MIDGLRDIPVDNEVLVEKFTTELKAEVARLDKHKTTDQDALRKDLVEVERGNGRCVDFIMSGDVVQESIRERLTTLEARKADLQAQLDRGEVSSVVAFHPNYAELNRKNVNEVADLLSNEETREKAMTAVRNLIDRIEVRAGAKRGETEVTLVGMLAGILALSTKKKAQFALAMHIA